MRKLRYLFMAVLLWTCIVPAWAQQTEALPVSAYVLQDTERVGLPGAAFTISRPGGAPLAFRQDGSVWQAVPNGETILTTGSSGAVLLTGLTAGAYELRQVDAPGMYRTLSQSIALHLDADGTLLVAGHAAAEVSILHRSGQHVVASVLLGLCSLLPALLRLAWLWGRKRHR